MLLAGKYHPRHFHADELNRSLQAKVVRQRDADEQRTIDFYDEGAFVSTAKIIRTIADAYTNNWIEALAVTRDGRHLAVGGQKRIIRHWDLETGTPLDSQSGHFDYIGSVQVTPDGATALTAAWDRQMVLWDLKSGREKQTIIMPPFD